jgi:starvation-inducible outer membrane lipoprotein
MRLTAVLLALLLAGCACLPRVKLKHNDVRIGAKCAFR